ncbi:MAG: response regulator [bacterium]|nr:response regulator [bacterium]
MTRSLNALIVDDSATTRHLIMRALSQTGLAEFTFTQAEDGLDALVQYSPGETEIIFVDMNMPRMGGLEFIRTLRVQHKRCPPTVMITAETNSERLAEAVSTAGVDAFLLKPVDRDRLQTGLRKLVDSIPVRSETDQVPHGECVPQALQEVLAEVCSLEISPEPEDESLRRGRIVLGIIGLHGDIQWSVSLAFPHEAAVAVTSKFARYEISSEGPDLGDAISELANIVGGRIKQLLCARNLGVSISLPTALGASDFRILHQPRSTTGYTHFNSPAGRLWCRVDVGIDSGMAM